MSEHCKTKRTYNNEIEKLLGVSDSNVTNYLDELEKELKVRQTGTGVYYELIG